MLARLPNGCTEQLLGWDLVPANPSMLHRHLSWHVPANRRVFASLGHGTQGNLLRPSHSEQHNAGAHAPCNYRGFAVAPQSAVEVEVPWHYPFDPDRNVTDRPLWPGPQPHRWGKVNYKVILNDSIRITKDYSSTAKYYSGTTPYYKVLDLQQLLRLARKVTLELHQVLRLPRKVTLDLHQVLRLPRKVTLDLHQVLRLPRKVTLELHQVLRLPHRMTRRLDPRHIWNVISNARSNKCHPPNSPNTAPATQNDHQTSGRNLRKTAETSFPMRGRSENDPRPFRPWSENEPVSPQPAAQTRLLFTLRTSIFYWKIQRFPLRLCF